MILSGLRKRKRMIDGGNHSSTLVMGILETRSGSVSRVRRASDGLFGLIKLTLCLVRLNEYQFRHIT